MGGGTGTGATPIIARELKRIDPNMLIVAVVTKYVEGNGGVENGGVAEHVY